MLRNLMLAATLTVTLHTSLQAEVDPLDILRNAWESWAFFKENELAAENGISQTRELFRDAGSQLDSAESQLSRLLDRLEWRAAKLDELKEQRNESKGLLDAAVGQHAYLSERFEEVSQVLPLGQARVDAGILLLEEGRQIVRQSDRQIDHQSFGQVEMLFRSATERLTAVQDNFRREESALRLAPPRVDGARANHEQTLKFLLDAHSQLVEAEPLGTAGMERLEAKIALLRESLDGLESREARLDAGREALSEVEFDLISAELNVFGASDLKRPYILKPTPRPPPFGNQAIREQARMRSGDREAPLRYHGSMEDARANAQGSNAQAKLAGVTRDDAERLTPELQKILVQVREICAQLNHARELLEGLNEKAAGVVQEINHLFQASNDSLRVTITEYGEVLQLVADIATAVRDADMAIRESDLAEARATEFFPMIDAYLSKLDAGPTEIRSTLAEAIAALER